MTEINGKLVSSIEDFRKIVSKRYNKVWLTSTEYELYNIFGKPKKYPFIFIELPKQYEDSAYESTKLTKIYF